MKQMVSHIEFLLHEHHCVIIPGFGGFVASVHPASREEDATFLPPECELAFNRELTHNDGLLAQAYMQFQQITFESAVQEIDRAVNELKQLLREKRYVELGRLGSFTMHDDKCFVYHPALFVRPDLFGLTPVSLKPLSRMRPTVIPLKPIRKQKRIRSIGVSAAAVAAVAILMMILPMGDAPSKRQTAQILSQTEWLSSPSYHSRSGNTIRTRISTHELSHITGEVFAVQSGEAETDDRLLSATPSYEADDVAALENFSRSKKEAAHSAATEKTDLPKYYIVAGVFSTQSRADKMVASLKNEGFAKAGQLERSGRFDVYLEVFIHEDAAKEYLRTIHQQYPAHVKAWILKR